ncbi:MAG: hypothetical protein IJA67_12590 [Oscillospiraceae bacterium]|nr:hypothetical protein [Oscillospiraceae bacterium]
MLNTPFGQIRIFADGHEIAYGAVPYECQVKSVKLHPLTGSYRITVPAWAHHKIRCVLIWTCPSIDNTGSSGERYRDAEFINGSTILTIGAEDDNPAYDTERHPDGMEYILRERVDSVTFGVAWADDYTDGDRRTWLAADPV